MNAKIQLTIAKLRKIFLISALAISPFLAVATSHAQFTGTATLTSGGANAISLAGNGTFTLTLAIMNTNFSSSGYTVFYQSNNGSGLFQITGRTNNDSTFFFNPITQDAVAFMGNNGILMPSNARDLGYTGDTVNNQPAGNFSLQTITIQLLNAAPGSYTIFLDTRSILTRTDNNGNFFDYQIGINTPNSPVFTVNVIPEPATIGLAIVGGGLLLLVIYRKQRVRA